MILGWEDPLEEGMATHSSTLCLENPMDIRAWQAAVLRVTQSQTRLKQLSSSSGSTENREDDEIPEIFPV